MKFNVISCIVHTSSYYSHGGKDKYHITNRKEIYCTVFIPSGDDSFEFLTIADPSSGAVTFTEEVDSDQLSVNVFTVVILASEENCAQGDNVCSVQVETTLRIQVYTCSNVFSSDLGKNRLKLFYSALEKKKMFAANLFQINRVLIHCKTATNFLKREKKTGMT